jgi:Tfp pilus assembly protein PilF
MSPTLEVITVEPAVAEFPSVAPQPRSGKTLLVALLLAAATLALYAPSLRNDFVGLDDPVYVTFNPLVRQGLSWHNIPLTFNAIVTGEWHPLALMSHMADVQMFGLKPAGHHFTSMLWHALNVVLLFLLLKKATGYMARSAVVAALFAVFPLNVETVAWIAERKSLLSMAFLLLALFAYGWYVRRPSIARYLPIMLFFALGLMSKSMIITLPCALLLVDYWPLKRLDLPGLKTAPDRSWGRTFLKLVAEKIPLFLLSVVSALITVRGMRRYGALVSADFYPLRWRIKNTIFSYLLYILKGLWPTHLSVFYPYQAGTLAMWKVVAAGLVLVAITAVVWHFREKRYLVTGWFWYLGTMVPVIGIVQVGHQAMADRYAYVPFLGLFVIAVWLVSELADRTGLSRPTLAAITFTVLAGCAVTTYLQIGYWHDTYSLYSHAVEVTTRNAFAEENLAELLVEKGRPDLAALHYEATLRYLPQWSVGHFNFGVMLQQQQRFVEAIREYQLALAYETDVDEACATHINLGAIFIRQNQMAAALSEFNTAIALRPTNGLAFLNRGLLEYSQGSLDAATNDFSQAVQFMPTPKNYFWLGRALEDQGALSQAANAYENVLQMEPDMNEAQARLNAIRPKLHP